MASKVYRLFFSPSYDSNDMKWFNLFHVQGLKYARRYDHAELQSNGMTGKMSNECFQ